MRRREALSIAVLAFVTVGTSACSTFGASFAPPQETPTPDPAEAWELVGLPAPGVPYTVEVGIDVSELDDWSHRITFTAEPDIVDAWLEEAFGSADGLVISGKGSLTQRIPDEDFVEGSRYFDGSNPEDPMATYAILMQPGGTDVIIALARTAR